MSRSRSRSPRNSRRRSRSRDRSEKRRSSPGRRARTRSRSRSTSPSRMTENDAVLNAWRNVKNDFSNFDAWMNLLNLVDQFNDVPVGREVYDRFLDRYPFCYGFWKKYADMERRNNNFTDTVKVWERAISAIPLSIDLWQGFLAFMRELAPVSDEGMDKLNSLYDRALSIAGLEFNSDRLWNEAIAWQESRGDWRKVASIYDKLLQTPTAMFKTHFERYTTIINMYEPDILLQDDEYDEIFSKLRKNTSVGIDQLVIEENVLEESGAPDEEGDRKPVMIPRKKHHPEALAFFRQEILARRQRWHERTAVMLSSRIPYEEQIKRPYFHVKELETTQLKNWREYLEFEVNEGDEARVLVLFERCVIACALYDTMWLKYARYAQKKKGSSAAREIFNRARVHCPKSVNIALAHSALEESKGDFTTALSVLNSFERRQPGFAAISMRKIGIARRQANSERNPDYADVTSQWEALIHSPGTARHLSSFYSIKLARFHLKCRNDRRLAEKVIRRALERDRDNVQLHLQLVDLAYTDPEFSQKKVLEAFDEALKSRLADEERLRLSQRKLDFLEDIGDDIQMLQEHTELHQSLLREIENPHLHTRKRKHERTTRDRDDSRDHRRDSRRDNRDRDSFGGPPQQQQMFYQPPQGQMYVPEFNYGFQQQQPNHNNYY